MYFEVCGCTCEYIEIYIYWMSVYVCWSLWCACEYIDIYTSAVTLSTYLNTYIHTSHLYIRHEKLLGVRLVGCLKLCFFFAKEPYKKDYILQKRLIILRSLLILVTPHPYLVWMCQKGSYWESSGCQTRPLDISWFPGGSFTHVLFDLYH